MCCVPTTPSVSLELGDDWKTALARVKNTHGAHGQQDQIVTDEARHAFDFVKTRDLVTVPPLCEELWRTLMMSTDAQKTLPFAADIGSLSPEDAARLLGISKTAVLKRIDAGRLLAWREKRLQAARFPRWRFDEHGHARAGLEAVLEILNEDERLNAWGRILFFLQER